ncbi:hypothetical protein KQX54_006122 [Cotesia glomerata]|uniref:Uncharacterized protein n=1 Tax=Cotesia glomerata TaxID=32391 RepID=A0AAV7IBU4_COTGL|nr:hypothetical protein KQX54_006122 [Cotesia glomerata]
MPADDPDNLPTLYSSVRGCGCIKGSTLHEVRGNNAGEVYMQHENGLQVREQSPSVDLRPFSEVKLKPARVYSKSLVNACTLNPSKMILESRYPGVMFTILNSLKVICRITYEHTYSHTYT